MEKKSNTTSIKCRERSYRKWAERALTLLLILIMTVTMTPQTILQSLGVKTEAEAASSLNNPKIEASSGLYAGQAVTYDCVWFGSYPQTEIVDQASNSGCYGMPWSTSSDYEVDASLYASLQGATYDSNGDTVIGNAKYRRVKKSDSTNDILMDEKNFFQWSDSETYHYFRYEPIKWRVLSVNGSQALLLSDIVLDDQAYHSSFNNVCNSCIWETSSMRSWLNGYGASSNACGVNCTNKNFIDSAFTSSEQNAIITTSLTNEDNLQYGTEAGNDTNDKIFLLSESDVYNTDKASSYGFVKDCDCLDEARVAMSSTFAKAMGVGSYLYSKGECLWMLRSPGYKSEYLTEVTMLGDVNSQGSSIMYHIDGCRPALTLDLSSSAVYSYAGTVCSDYLHTHTEIRNAKEATCREEGYTGDTYCKDCGLKLSEGEIIPKTNSHRMVFGTLKSPTAYESGYARYICSVCGLTETTYLPATGPQTSEEDTDVVIVSKTSLSSVKNTKGAKLTLKWKKNSKVTGYMIQISTDPTFATNTITKVINSNKTTSYKSPKLKKKKTYYVRLCSYWNLCGKIYYADWCKVKKVKIKK